ncbi:MAG: hypothetical protein Tsb0014_43320 [Pleurocapsa sp.]
MNGNQVIVDELTGGNISDSLVGDELTLSLSDPITTLNTDTDKTLTIGEVTGAAGGKITVPIEIDNQSGLNSVGLTIKYDTTLLDVVDPDSNTDTNEAIKRVEISQDWNLSTDQELPNPVANVDDATGEIKIALINPGQVPTDTTGGNILEIDFTIDPAADLNDVANIELSAAELGVNSVKVDLGDSLLNDGAITVGASASLDIDGNGATDAGTDGILIIRHLIGFTGDTLINGAVDTQNGTRTEADKIQAYLANLESNLDVDGNGVTDAGTDGILIIRHLIGFTGDTLINGAVANESTRTADDIANAINDLIV